MLLPIVELLDSHNPPPISCRLLGAESAALDAGGNVLRLVGLYHAGRGPHTFFIKMVRRACTFCALFQLDRRCCLSFMAAFAWVVSSSFDGLQLAHQRFCFCDCPYTLVAALTQLPAAVGSTSPPSACCSWTCGGTTLHLLWLLNPRLHLQRRSSIGRLQDGSGCLVQRPHQHAALSFSLHQLLHRCLLLLAVAMFPFAG
jgi:hypothetical protein